MAALIKKYLFQALAILKKFGVTVAPFLKWLVLLLIPIAVFFYLRWKKKKNLAGHEEKAKLPKNSLKKIYQKFLSGLPAHVRRSILNFEPYVVLGEAGSGKSEIINNYSDWEAQSLAFYPSYSTDPNLQLYLASGSLIQEIPSTLLHDVSSSAADALKRLWRQNFVNRNPQVIVCLNISKITQLSPEELRRRAQLLRGKINLLSWISKKTVTIRFVLSHMDQIKGFESFAKFCEINKLPLKLDLNKTPGQRSSDQDKGLKDAFSEFEKQIPLALTKLNSSEFKDYITFLKNFPKTFSVIEDFSYLLTKKESLSNSAIIQGLYLLSNQIKSSYSQPFKTKNNALGFGFNPHEKHKLIAASLAFIFSGYLVYGFLNELSLYEQAKDSFEKLEKVKSNRHEKFLFDQVNSFTLREEKDPLYYYFPNFFESRSKKFQSNYSAFLRKKFLNKGLNDSFNENDPHKRSLYFLGSIYSSSQNHLGKTILKNLKNWSQVTGLAPYILSHYIKNTPFPWSGKVNLDNLPYKISQKANNNESQWLSFLDTIQEDLKKSYISADYLIEIQKEAESLENSIIEIQKYRHSKTLIELLKEKQQIDIIRIYGPFLKELSLPETISKNSDNLMTLIKTILKDRIDVGSSKKPTLNELDNKLDVLLKENPEFKRVFRFKFSKNQFEIANKDWFELIRTSKVVANLNNFMKQNSGRESYFFFQKPESFQDILMNPYNDGTSLFTGKKTVRGIYTAEAVKKEIIPNLVKFSALLVKIKLSEQEKSLISNFLYQEMERYAENFEKEIDTFYQGFNIEAKSEPAIKIILRQMLKPVSPFTDFLRSVYQVTNVKFPEKQNIFLYPLREKFAIYKPLTKILSQKENNFPELEKYKTILAQVLTELETPAKDNDEEEELEKNESLNDNLGAAGKFALKVLNKAPETSFTLTENWLSSVNIKEKKSKELFLKPLKSLYLIGLSEVESSMANIWRYKIKTAFKPVLEKFPFSNNLEKELSSKDLIKFLEPTAGVFSQIERNFLLPICNKRGFAFSPKKSFIGKINLPLNLLLLSGHLSQLSSILWDKGGQPKKIEIEIKTVPFEMDRRLKNRLTLAYLNSGPSSLFSFNQKPSWKKFSLDWTKLQTSQIGVQLTNPKTGENSYRILNTKESFWSFYHLLFRAKQIEKGLWKWKIPLADSGISSPQVELSIKENPWNIFRLRN